MQWTKNKILPKPKKKPVGASGNLFSVPLIGAIIHNKETRMLLRSVDNGTSLIRDAIIDHARQLGFKPLDYGDSKPDYIDDDLWNKIIIAQQKSYYVDYSYVIAFYWLKSLPKYSGYTKSRLIREIILT